jgi:hypothetical protein
VNDIFTIDRNRPRRKYPASGTGLPRRAPAYAARQEIDIIATWSDGCGLAVVGAPGGHSRVDLNLYPVTRDVASGC